MKGLLCFLGTFVIICTLMSACKEKDMSMKMNTPRNIRGVISYKRSFGDLNDTRHILPPCVFSHFTTGGQKCQNQFVKPRKMLSFSHKL